MLDEAVDALCEDALEVALPGPAARVGRHHARHGRVGAQERAELGRRLELGREDRLRARGGGASVRAAPRDSAEGGTHLEHGEEKVLLARLVLVAVQREHDSLEERVDLAQRHEAAQRGDVSRFGLEEEEEVRVLLLRDLESAGAQKRERREGEGRTCCRRSSMSVSSPSSTSSRCILTSSRSSSAMRCKVSCVSSGSAQ